MLVFLIQAALLASTVAVQAQFDFTTNDGSITITGYTGGDAMIPSSTNGLPVTSIGEGAFEGCFLDLTNVTIPDSVTNIGYYAFIGCSKLASLTIPNSVTSLGDYAFDGCTGLTNVNVGSSVKSIGEWAFFDCNGLTDITLPNSVTTVGDDAFLDCTSLADITLPDSVTNIGQGAFSGCSLTNLTLDGGVISIGSGAFQGCRCLTAVEIPSSVISIGLGAFEGCVELTNITVDLNNPAYSSAGGVLFDVNLATLIQFPTGLGGSYVIPSSVTSIGEDAFLGCSGLTRVTLGSGISTIGSEAFTGCASLTNITVGPSNPAYSSADGVLFNLSQTALIAFPGGKAGIYAIPDGVTNLGGDAFYGCANLTSVFVPVSVVSISDPVFYLCSGLTNVTVDPDNPVYSSVDGVLIDVRQSMLVKCPCGRGGSYVIPNSVTSIGEEAFLDCISLKSVTIPNSVNSLGFGAFEGCTCLASVDIPNSVTSIGVWAFEYCDNLTNLIIGSGVTNIGDFAFDSCPKLASLTLGGPKSVDSAFTDCFWPAFGGWPTLTSVTLLNTVTSIGSGAFEYWTSLTRVSLGNGITNIGESAFEYCNRLTNITIPGSVTTIGTNALADTGLISLTIPSSVTDIGGGAFSDCYYLRCVLFLGNVPNENVPNRYGGYENLSGLPSLFEYGYGGELAVYYLPGTKGWETGPDDGPGVSLNILPWNPQVQTGDGSFGVLSNVFGFHIAGTPGIPLPPLVVEACTNVSNGIWVPLQSNGLAYGNAYFCDPQWTNYPSRFYRFRVP